MQRAAEDQVHGPGMGEQLRPQLEGQRPDAVSPRQCGVGEPVVDATEELFNKTVQYRGLVREVGVDGVGCDADTSRQGPDGDPVRAALGEQGQCRVKDLLLAESPPGTGATSPHIDHVSS
jgi:hypothetical protein